MLLGQYSDDEVDEELVEVLKRAASEDSSLDHEDKGKHSGDDETNVNGEIGSTVMEVEEKAIDNGSDLPSPSDRPAEDSARENNASVSVDLHAQLSVLDQITAPTTSDAQALVDASAGWKMVLHEESNQYYYWNTVTGETSWEVPQILGHAVEPRLEEKVTAETECMGGTTLENLEPSAKMDMDTRQTGVSYSDINEYRKPTDDDLHDKKGDNDEDQSGTINGSEQIDSQCNEISSPGGSLSSGKSDHAPEGNLNGPGEDFTKCSDADYVPEDEAEADFSSDLVKHCERLLKQLETMKGSEFFVQYDRISKYALELEIRLADIRSLACNGLSLLPFWVHSERKIKLLDSEINQLCGLFLSGQQNDVEADHVSHRGSDNVNDANGESSSCPATTGDASEESGATGVHEDLTPQTVLHPAEEVDMDVDMEVEDTEPSRSLTVCGALHAPNHAPLDGPSLSVQQTKLESSILEQTPNVPPPPDEDWIPPPPPDNEPFPPPPPDEPVDHTHAVPSNMESVQSFPYNLAYPGSTFDYYGQTNPEIASSLYGTSDGQIAVTHHPLYYQIPTTYSVAPVAINHVDPSAYYGHQDGALQPVSVVSGTGSSGLPAIPVHETVAPDTTPSLDVNKGSRSDLSAKSEADVPADLENEKTYFDVPATQSSVATETVSAMEGVGVSSTSVATGAVATASTAPSKVPSKVLRKRTVGVVSTLRSNKKVSSLVDKWKAAKEELHAEEEEERESALEKLEKKRQREIEEWRAQQIASGEAKDNANFQPLGGDWRERVKRKRVEKMREAEKQLSEENEQPDLDVISRGLPSGWKAYWDDSTKQVYYGKAVTSETSWNRPTN
ncbi:formin-binding protein 4 isoform X2 [Solanum pennellii]|nr:formin-binding protein 4 isoform X2 [Solanum pennellii]XP_027768277.1 formin-binding protein 4 isoform X2 [Solanum pennellii]